MRHLAPKDRGSSADQTNVNLKPVETVPGAASSTAAKVAPEVSFSIVNIAGMERGGEWRGGERWSAVGVVRPSHHRHASGREMLLCGRRERRRKK